jgi:integrase
MGYLSRQTPHGFRHTASTWLNELDYNKDAIELQLMHVIPGARGVYNKAEKIHKRIPMMQAWADWVDDL